MRLMKAAVKLKMKRLAVDKTYLQKEAPPPACDERRRFQSRVER
jgi:hypothetical protein